MVQPAPPRPKKFPFAKIRWKSSHLPRFFGIKTASSSLNISNGQTSNAEYYSLLLVQLKDILKGKNQGRGMLTRGSCSCTTMLRLTWHLQPRRNLPTWASNVLTTHPILRICSRRNTTCSLDWRKQLKVRHFRLMGRSLLPRRPGWTDIVNFFWLA